VTPEPTPGDVVTGILIITFGAIMAVAWAASIVLGVSRVFG